MSPWKSAGCEYNYDVFTLGIATCNDFDSLYFTIQTARILHKEITEIIIVDNSINQQHCDLAKSLTHWSGDIQIKLYLAREKQSTSVRDDIFQYATNEYVIVCDSHVVLFPEAVRSLKEYYENHHRPYDLIHGPMVYDDLKTYSTHMEPVWRDNFYGIWATQKTDEPFFEIPMMGMGCFSCKKSEWLGFNKQFKGFGGEEGYIHEKYRQKGGKVVCVQGFKWLHKFPRLNVPYPNNLDDRINNYITGWTELGKDCIEIYEHFKILPR